MVLKNNSHPVENDNKRLKRSMIYDGLSTFNFNLANDNFKNDFLL